MSYRVVFTVEAHVEADEIAAYYAEQFDTGAMDFLDALLDTVDAIERNPLGYRVRFVDQRDKAFTCSVETDGKSFKNSATVSPPRR